MSRQDRIRRLTGGGTYRQSEDGVIEAAENGTFTIRSWDRDQPWSELGATWIDADNQVGETARISFVQGSSLLPVFFSRGSKPNNKIVPEITGFELVWRRRGTWQCALGAELDANIPGAALDNTEICTADFQYWDFVIKKTDGTYVVVGTYSSNYVGNCYVMAWNFFTGQQLWTEPVLAFDRYPQVEYVPTMNAVFVSGFRETLSGGSYSYTEAAKLLDLDTGAVLNDEWPDPAVTLDMSYNGGNRTINDQRQLHWFINNDAELKRFYLPVESGYLFHERIVGLTGYQFQLAGGEAHQADGTLTYEGSEGSAGVVLENTSIRYNWCYDYYEACDHNSKPVEAYTGFGYRRLGIYLEWNQPQRTRNAKRKSLFSTSSPAHEASYARPEYWYDTDTTIFSQNEVDRMGIKVKAISASGATMEWERTWAMSDHSQVIVDDNVKTLATLKSEWEASVVSAAESAYTTLLGNPSPGGLRAPSSWDLSLDNATLVGSPESWSIQADLTTGIPGGAASGGWAMSQRDSGINLTCETPDRAHVHNGNFSPNYDCFANGNIQGYATGVSGTGGATNDDVNLYSSRVTSTRANGERLVINYTTPSYNDLYANGYYTARRWRGTKTGTSEDLGYIDSANNGGYTFIVDDPSELPTLFPDDVPDSANLWNWLVRDDLNYYTGENIDLGGTDYWYGLSYHSYLAINSLQNNNVFKNYFCTGSPDLRTTVADIVPDVSAPATYAGYDVINEDQYFDPFNREWEDDATASRLEVTKDFDYRIARSYAHLPRGGKSAVTVLREVDDQLVEECTLEFGDDFEKFSSHGTSRYPYVNGTPGDRGLWVDRITWSNTADYTQGLHTTKVERYDWDGTLVYSHDVPSNPWSWTVVCANDVSTGRDFLLIQNLGNGHLHLYDEDGFVRTYTTMTGYLYNGAFWIVDEEIYYTEYGSQTATDVSGQFTYAGNKIIKL